MRSFSIRDLERFSGIKAHTIRVWENRYSFPKPQRNLGNTRYYSLEQTALFFNVVLLNQNGYRISKLVQLSADTITKMLGDLNAEDVQQRKAVFELLLLMYVLEIEEFETLLDRCVHLWGIDQTITEVILPFLQKADIFSYRNTGGEIHFSVTAIRRKIILGIESIKLLNHSSSKALLFLPEGEHYDLLLLYACYRLRKSGVKVLYLGTNVSAKNLLAVMEEKKPALLYCHLPAGKRFDIERFSEHLVTRFPETMLCVIETEPDALRLPYPNVEFCHYKKLTAFNTYKSVDQDRLEESTTA